MPCYEIDGVVPVVEPNAYVHPDAVLIGDVIVESGCYIGPLASLRGDLGRIIVGAGSNVQDCCVLHSFPGRDLTLAPESHIGHAAVLHGCTVETKVMIGMNAVVMDDVVVGEESLVGANSFVPAGTVIPPRSLVAGNPAKVVRTLDDQTLAWKANGLRVYQNLAVRSLASLRPAEPLTAVEVDRHRVQTGRDVSSPLHEFKSTRSEVRG
ncbi:2,3,4,5-tetrahydropyridine-2,6-dicarboxylate N-acetyltransferase [Rhodococcus sp. Br-6]|nr:2,3,4,5-tetrahydropyridine-2,6-dicarboxylate N-acetyltransferase [Rhodococcus sp. Br-6]